VLGPFPEFVFSCSQCPEVQTTWSASVSATRFCLLVPFFISHFPLPPPPFLFFHPRKFSRRPRKCFFPALVKQNLFQLFSGERLEVMGDKKSSLQGWGRPPQYPPSFPVEGLRFPFIQAVNVTPLCLVTVTLGVESPGVGMDFQKRMAAVPPLLSHRAEPIRVTVVAQWRCPVDSRADVCPARKWFLILCLHASFFQL